jgi:type II secretory pathway pseudopilin PulG
MRNERGITLVALVVTIVVLLILAGVTITYALSNNGLFTKAQETAMVSEQATIRDAVSSAQAECMMEYYDASKTTKTPAKDLITKYVPAGWTVTATTAPTITSGVIAGTVTVATSSYTHTVKIANGVVTEITAVKK